MRLIRIMLARWSLKLALLLSKVAPRLMPKKGR
jgi:hypothetical protein